MKVTFVEPQKEENRDWLCRVEKQEVGHGVYLTLPENDGVDLLGLYPDGDRSLIMSGNGKGAESWPYGKLCRVVEIKVEPVE